MLGVGRSLLAPRRCPCKVGRVRDEPSLSGSCLKPPFPPPPLPPTPGSTAALRALESVLTEVARVRAHGFSPKEV